MECADPYCPECTPQRPDSLARQLRREFDRLYGEQQEAMARALLHAQRQLAQALAELGDAHIQLMQVSAQRDGLMDTIKRIIERIDARESAAAWVNDEPPREDADVPQS